MKKREKLTKKAQITIFVIIGIVIISALIFIFGIIIKNSNQQNVYEKNPKRYVEDCLSNSLKETEETLFATNIYSNITENYLIYRGNKVPYLCKSSIFYSACINQEPMLMKHYNTRIENLMSEEINNCFLNFKESMIKKGYKIDFQGMNSSIEITPETISLEIDRKTTLTKYNETILINKYFAKTISPLYSLIKTTKTIVDYESTLCEFNQLGWMSKYTGIKVSRFLTSDQSKVYTVSDRVSNNSISFAIKTCVLPAGI